MDKKEALSNLNDLNDAFKEKEKLESDRRRLQWNKPSIMSKEAFVEEKVKKATGSKPEKPWLKTVGKEPNNFSDFGSELKATFPASILILVVVFLAPLLLMDLYDFFETKDLSFFDAERIAGHILVLIIVLGTVLANIISAAVKTAKKDSEYKEKLEKYQNEVQRINEENRIATENYESALADYNFLYLSAESCAEKEYDDEYLPKVQKQARNCQLDIDRLTKQIERVDKRIKAIDFLPSDYKDQDSVARLIKILENLRANDLTGAINILVSDRYNEKLISDQEYYAARKLEEEQEERRARQEREERMMCEEREQREREYQQRKRESIEREMQEKRERERQEYQEYRESQMESARARRLAREEQNREDERKRAEQKRKDEAWRRCINCAKKTCGLRENPPETCSAFTPF